MTTELPYEIWVHILSFLDTETIRQLRFVNTLLYNLSLDDYYRITQIGYPNLFADNAPLWDPGYAKRAKTLIIRRGPIYSRKYKPPRSPLGYRWPIWKSIKAKFSQMRRHVVGHEPETFLDQLLDAVPGLTTLTTLDVSLPYNLEDPFFHTTKLSVIKAGWSVFGASLTTLSFNMPLEEIHLISLSHIRLLRLENFSIVLQIFHPTSQPNELIRKSVLPFLIAHGPTLRSLELVALKKVDMSSILNGLRHMPRLNSLNISHHFRSLKLTSLIGHHQFLKVHQSQLQHLTFETQSFCSDMEITDEFFNQEWCHVLLPELRSLSFSLSGFRVSCEAAAIPYFQRHISTVKSLTILALYFSYDQVASILTGPKQGGYQLTALRTLNIQIWCFSPALLSLLADQAPQLRSLKLYVCVIGPDKQPESFASNRVPEFCEALKSYYFAEWGLYELELWPLPPSLRNQCRVALFRALPNLKEFCGLDPEGFTAEEQASLSSILTLLP